MGTVWVVRDMAKGGMQYAVFSTKPKQWRNGFQSSARGCIRIDVRNEIGKEVAGRKLKVGECIEVICSEVVG
tara:strand:- start:1294 stop:1509 length:216 start_codon:yes stop_codon:yes gene_type:complete